MKKAKKINKSVKHSRTPVRNKDAFSILFTFIQSCRKKTARKHPESANLHQAAILNFLESYISSENNLW